MDRAQRSPDRCQQIIDLIDACLAEYQGAVVTIDQTPLRTRRRQVVHSLGVDRAA